MADKNSPTSNNKVSRKLLRTKASWLENTFYAVWSLIGVALIVLAAVAIFGSDSWVENLNITSSSQTEEVQPTQAQPQQPTQPTQEQLDCVASELGDSRFEELQQGGQANQEETTVIQQCLQN